MENKQHVQLPNDLGSISFIKPKDQFVYVVIKKFMNKDTKEAFPSLNTLHQITKLSINTIRDCINRLIKSRFIEVRKEGRKNIYKFLKHDTFEPFSFKFIEKKDLTPEEKAYLIASQKYMFKEGGEGKIALTNKELADKINLSESSIIRINNSLTEKQYMTTLKMKTKDNETGLFKSVKFYHLNQLEQAIIFVLQNHEERIEENTTSIKQLQKENKSIKQDLQIALRRIEELEKKQQIQYTL